MAGKVLIELDLDIVQEAIKLDVAPAVREFLAQHYDIPAMIRAELGNAQPEKLGPQSTYEALARTMLPWGLMERPRGRALVEKMVREEIEALALDYVKESLEARREAVAGAFRQMMRDSPDRLVEAFVKMVEGADLELELTQELRVKEEE